MQRQLPKARWPPSQRSVRRSEAAQAGCCLFEAAADAVFLAAVVLAVTLAARTLRRRTS